MFQVNKSTIDFWRNLKLTWQQCANLPDKCWASSVAELNGKVYTAIMDVANPFTKPLMYDSNKDQWSTLPALPYGHFSLVTVPDRKQLLAIGGVVKNRRMYEVSNKVFLWDEENRKWTTPYPNMPTARYSCSSISQGSTVIVAGGVICKDPWTMTRAVEVLHIKEQSESTKSYPWSVVEQLPHVVRNAIPLIINDKLCLAQGYDEEVPFGTCTIVAASIPELLQSSYKKSSSSQVWNKLPDMPYSSYSINHYQGHLIIFGGSYQVERSDEHLPVQQSVPLIHIYNPDTRTWDCVGGIDHRYLLGRSIHIGENKFLFIGGLVGDITKNYNMLVTCSLLTLSNSGRPTL